MRVMVAIFVRNRFGHLKLCAEWLEQSKECYDTECDIVYFDDGSDDERVLEFLKDRQGVGLKAKPGWDGNARIGFARKSAVDWFLRMYRSDAYLLLMDSDIITNKKAIEEAVLDYDELRQCDFLKPGLWSLHAQAHLTGQLARKHKIFATADLTGEANMLLNRDDLQLVGNHFSEQHKGFGDIQIRATYKMGRSYCTRVEPPYQVQHIGVGDGGSDIFQGAKKPPSWTRIPYRRHNGTRTPIAVSGFDMDYYMNCVNQVGGAKAPLVYLEKKGVAS